MLDVPVCKNAVIYTYIYVYTYYICMHESMHCNVYRGIENSSQSFCNPHYTSKFLSHIPVFSLISNKGDFMMLWLP